jgi:methionyl-tRNA formyltransferase
LKKLRVVFCGTPDFSVPTLDVLHNHPSTEVVSVVSMPSRPKGRGMELQDPEVIAYAKNNRIPFFQCENINKEEEFLTELEKKKVDVIVVLAFAQFLGSRILQLPKVGCFNIHTSILPRFRGAAPIQHAIFEGDSETGVSIQKMVKKMDAGDLVHFKKVPIIKNETGGSLYTKLKYEAGLATNEFLKLVLKDSLVFSPQDESKVTFAPTLKRQDGNLKFSTKTTAEIDRQIRALYPWPGTYTFLNGKRLKVFKVENYPTKLNPGELKTDENMLLVGCQDGTVRLCEVQLEGKKASDDQTLLNGLKNKFKEFQIEEKA